MATVAAMSHSLFNLTHASPLRTYSTHVQLQTNGIGLFPFPRLLHMELLIFWHAGSLPSSPFQVSVPPHVNFREDGESLG